LHQSGRHPIPRFGTSFLAKCPGQKDVVFVSKLEHCLVIGCRVERKEFLARKSAQVAIFKPLHLVRSRLMRRMLVAISVFLNPVAASRSTFETAAALSGPRLFI